MRLGISIVAFMFISFFALSRPVEVTEPVVKKSKSGICHEKGSTYYARTKKFTSYSSMDLCLKSGGRRPKK